MHLRVTAAAMALLATSQVASSRAIDVSGQTLAASMPSETLVAAYVTAGQADHETAAFARAIRDHARGIGLDGWQLRGASFADAVMPKVSLRGADLRGAVFDRADLFGADLSRALAAGARFQHVDLAGFPKVADGGIFTGARLNGTDFTGADLRGSIFNKLPDLLPDGAVDPASCGTPPEMLDGAVFTRANLEDATLEGVDFTRLGNIEGAIFKGAKLACAIFDCAMLEAVDFTGADLRAATFKSADVSDAPGAGTSGTCPVPPAPPPVP